ncbi:MAG: alpha-hydroxy-acid oxidizing protein [Chloroflexota bacterium]
MGGDGLIVSNHGGRQFDAAPTTVANPSIRNNWYIRANSCSNGGK